jgi:hypothetical protein
MRTIEKRYILKLIAIAFVFSIYSSFIFSQPSPIDAPGGGGGYSNGNFIGDGSGANCGCANGPIDSGLGILVLLSLSYGIRKIVQIKKRKIINEQSA